MDKRLLHQLIKPLMILAAVIIGSAVLARFLMRGDTLAEHDAKYAADRPATVETADEIDDSASVGIVADDDGDMTGDGADGGGADDGGGAEPVMPVSQWSVGVNMYVYQPGFTSEPLSDALFAYIQGISFPITIEEARSQSGGDDAGLSEEELYDLLPNIVENADEISVSREDLVFLSLLHHNPDGQIHLGEMICHRDIADDLLFIFYELYSNDYWIGQIRLIDEYGGDDTLSMLANNTSSFNYRESSPGRLSQHSYGLAVDINPFYNPYVVYSRGEITRISPEGSEAYVDREYDFPYKINADDLAYRLFTERGFTWGGDWNNIKDYHHFVKELD